MTPDYRATVARGRLTLADWTPWLASGGPLGVLLRRRGRAGVTFADLTVLREHDDTAQELIVDVVAGDCPDARATLVRWAGSVGYRRVWLPDEVVEPPAGNVGGSARVRCAACGARWEDGDADFWARVRHTGAFPTGCPLCGLTMPQWQVASAPCEHPLSDGDGALRPSRRG